MKSFITLTIIILMYTCYLVAEERGPRPQLTSSQKSQLDAATTKEAKDALLKSWGIEPPKGMKPPPRYEPPADGKGKKNISSEDISNLMNSYSSAQTDEEKQQLREEIKHSFYGASSEDKSKIRSFLMTNPDSSFPSTSSPSDTSDGGAW